MGGQGKGALGNGVGMGGPGARGFANSSWLIIMVFRLQNACRVEAIKCCVALRFYRLMYETGRAVISESVTKTRTQSLD